ncbi:MAG: hypothetical protein D6814_18360, partial [Calditrichaeota bacterium]
MLRKHIFISAILIALGLFFVQVFNGPLTPSTYIGSDQSGARRALEQLNFARTYPDTHLPEATFFKSFRTMQRMRRIYKRSQDRVAPWRALGPANIGGRTLAIAINPQNPNTIYAGSASGGLWRSYTGGEGANAWEHISTGFPVLAVSAIAISPADSNVIYIGTGEVYGHFPTQPGVSDRRTRGSYGIGILKSMDGGLTWYKSLDWTYNQRTGVQKIRINPKNAHTLWAATTEGTFLSCDAGSSWRKVLDVVMATDIAIDPADTNVVFVACGGMGSPGHGIYRTLDGGNTWEKLSMGPSGPSTFSGKAMLSISQSSPNIIYASIGNSDGELVSKNFKTWLMKSVDGGETWEAVSTVDYSRHQGWYSHYAIVHPQNPDIVYCGGVNLWKSTDGGHTLRRIDTRAANGRIHVDHHDMAFVQTSPDTLYFANDGGVYKSINGGKRFINCNFGYQTTQFYNGFTSAATDSNFALGGMQDNSTALYSGEPDWASVIGGDGSWTAINQMDHREFYGSLQWLRMFRWDDLNQEWQDITPPVKGVVNFIAPFALSPVDNKTLYAASSFVYKS